MDPETIALIAGAAVGLGKTLYTHFTNQNTYEARSPLHPPPSHQQYNIL